jgi:trans-2,3-dihydro-3-hydroxyanthranilate isomerase
VVLDAVGLSSGQMQALALEFNYTETTFVLPPRDPAHTAQVRIFTPDREIPFAGHPNVGTACILARRMVAQGEIVPDQFVFEEKAGLVPVTLLQKAGMVVGAELIAPEPLSRHTSVSPEQAAACLYLEADDLRIDAHLPQVVSVGLPFLVVELASRDALRRARPNRQGYDGLLPLDGAKSIYLDTRDTATGDVTADCDLQARMFTGRMTEDPATGSASAAATALLAELRGVPEISLRIRQGVDMGRPSLLLTRAEQQDGGVTAFVGGNCVDMLNGSIELAGDDKI